MMVNSELSAVSKIVLLMTHNSQLTNHYYETYTWFFSLSE